MMPTWMDRLLRVLPGSRTASWPADAARPAAETGPARPKRLTVPREYQSLHEYLDKRFATTVVLTFSQIEDLLGFALPDLARLRLDWWGNDATSTGSAPSRSWTQASRTATANLLAQTVVFERAPA